MQRQKKKGFTLIELLVVIAVIAILFIVIISKVNFASDRAKDSGVLTDFRSYQIGIQQTIREGGLLESESIADFTAKLNKNLDKELNIVQNGTEHRSIAYNPYGYQYVITKNGYEIKVFSINNQGGSELLGQETLNVYADNEYSNGKVMTVTVNENNLDIDVTKFCDNTSVKYQTKAEPEDDGEVVVNNKPIAIITMTPSESITNETVIDWSYGSSTAKNGATIVDAEWVNKTLMYTAGSQTVKLRVQDSNEVWSDWVETTFTVTQVNHKPTASFYMQPSTSVPTDTNIQWFNTSTDQDNGDTIDEVEWKLDGIVVTELPTSFSTEGNHEAQLRVRDNQGLWSDWASVVFTVFERFTTRTFSSTGEQHWTVPETGTYRIELNGARGGNGGTGYKSSTQGSYGGCVVGNVNLTAGDDLTIYIGRSGVSGTNTGSGYYVKGYGGSGGGSSAILKDGVLLVEARGGKGGDGGTDNYGGMVTASGLRPGGSGYNKGGDATARVGGIAGGLIRYDGITLTETSVATTIDGRLIISKID